MGRVFFAGGRVGMWRPGSRVPDMTISYSGDMEDAGVVTMSDGEYRLLTLTSSGTLTVEEEVNAEVWMCGGGTSGRHTIVLGGGGGAGAFTATGKVTLTGSITAVIGSGGATSTNVSPYYNAGGASSFGDIATPVNFSIQDSIETTSASYIGCCGVNGGSGGGAAPRGVAGTGDGLSKYPFGDSVYFDKPHCAGGGAGASYSGSQGDDLIVFYAGGNGGSNGESGGDYSVNGRILYGEQEEGDPTVAGGTGGSYGGGHGGPYNAMDATFYGSGGGGAKGNNNNAGGAGYQGVIYIRIPVDQ